MNRRGFLKAVFAIPVAAKMGLKEPPKILPKVIEWKHKAYTMGFRVSKEIANGWKDIVGRPGT